MYVEVLYIQSSQANKMIHILLICKGYYPIRHYAIEVNKLLAILMSSILISPRSDILCVLCSTETESYNIDYSIRKLCSPNLP